MAEEKIVPVEKAAKPAATATKKPAVKKPAVKKPAVKKPVAEKPAAKAVKKPVAKKSEPVITITLVKRPSCNS